jgi:hypothetical protein
MFKKTVRTFFASLKNWEKFVPKMQCLHTKLHMYIGTYVQQSYENLFVRIYANAHHRNSGADHTTLEFTATTPAL